MNARKKLKIGIVGCGAIGSQLARAIEQRFSEQAELAALCDLDQGKAKRLMGRLSFKPEICSIDELINKSELIIEAAQPAIAFEVAQKALRQNKDVMIMSVGGILDRQEELFALARNSGRHLYLPSGALCGLDAVKSASMAKIKSALLITRKPLKALEGAPYLVKKNINLSKLKKETVIFEGPASQAIKGFPKNVNVCATLSLAGIGAEKTKVRIITSPDYKVNVHEIHLEGDFGRLVTRTENLPAPENLKTSFLASLSAIATLKSILEPVKIGT